MPSEDYSEPTSDETTGDEPKADEESDTGDTSDDTEITEPEEDKEVADKVDYEKMFNDTKQAFTKASMELAEMRGRVDVLTKVKEEPVKDWIDDIEPGEEGGGDAIKAGLKSLRSEIATVLTERDEAIMQALQDQNPEVARLKDKVDELAKDPAYAGFTKAQLAVVVGSIGTTVKSKAVKARGKAGGERVAKVNAPEDVKNSPLFKAIYPHLAEAKKEDK